MLVVTGTSLEAGVDGTVSLMSTPVQTVLVTSYVTTAYSSVGDLEVHDTTSGAVAKRDSFLKQDGTVPSVTRLEVRRCLTKWQR